MTPNEVVRFIDRYSKFYFKNTDVTDKDFENVGIPLYLNRTELEIL